MDNVLHRRLEYYCESMAVATSKHTSKNIVFLGRFVIHILVQVSPEVIVVASY
jgi:hypothetical protein